MIYTRPGGPQMELSVYVDGKFYPQSEAKVSVFDHGLLYGDGVFEGIRAYNGRVFKLDRHLDRLYHSAKAIDLKIPHTKEEMANIIPETGRRNDIREGYIRPVITRGKGDLGLDPRKCKSGRSVVVIAQPGISLYGKVYERGLKMVTSSYRRVPPQSLSPSIKSLNYLNNIMARVEANQYGADEALMLDIHGYVSEATAENFFIIRNSTIVTPWTSTNLPGVTRETVLEIVPQLGLKAEERLFTLYDVWSADEAFISGTAAEIGPVVELDGRTIGGGKPADSLDEARSVAGQILGMDIHGYRVKQVYLEERLDIGRELYVGLTIDRSAREPLLMASGKGGIDIEAVPHDQIYMEHIPAVIGIQPYVLRSLLKELALPKELGDQVGSVVRNAYDLFRKEDAELVEINPLVVTKDGRVVAGAAKLVIDDNAEYRHPEYANLDQDRTPLEQEAHDKGITFIQLDGDIGVIANGAGLTMATLDILSLKGGKGGTFLDLGGTDDPAKVKQAFELLIKANPSVILLNIFGAITKADTVALGVKQALEEMHTKIPVVARIKGVNEAQAQQR